MSSTGSTIIVPVAFMIFLAVAQKLLITARANFHDVTARKVAGTLVVASWNLDV